VVHPIDSILNSLGTVDTVEEVARNIVVGKTDTVVVFER
jgi:hypothetical protein